MNEFEAYALYEEALEQWEEGDDAAFYESSATLNEWMHYHGEGAMLPEDWYPADEAMQNAMWDWINTLSHDERETFFGY